MDWALNAPVPWRARECLRAGTLHIGGSLAESEQDGGVSAEGEEIIRQRLSGLGYIS